MIFNSFNHFCIIFSLSIKKLKYFVLLSFILISKSLKYFLNSRSISENDFPDRKIEYNYYILLILCSKFPDQEILKRKNLLHLICYFLRFKYDLIMIFYFREYRFEYLSNIFLENFRISEKFRWSSL